MRWRSLLLPFSFLYAIPVWIRRQCYKYHFFSSFQSPIPTICVGNLSVGGTGKTPHVEYLIRILSQQRMVATLSRGYGRKTKGFILANQYDPVLLSSAVIGDEPLQFYTKFPEVKVAVAEKRKVGLEQLSFLFPDLKAIILDDAYQHLQVTPHCKILLTDYHHSYDGDWPLPAGNLREFSVAAREADMIIVTKSPTLNNEQEKLFWRRKLSLSNDQPLFFTQYIYQPLFPVNEKAKTKSATFGTSIFLLTGIANPDILIKYIIQYYILIHHYEFPDHHPFSENAIQKICEDFLKNELEDKILVTTEKDWMRLKSDEKLKKMISLLPVFVIPIEVKFLFDEETKFNKIIEDYVRKN
ncbi:MAG: tetraacyldisaccharide 4'-kinase [Bacteroidales bacterium]